MYQREQDLKIYNLSLTRFNEMLAKQNFKCPVCKIILDYIPKPGKRISVQIDHDHGCCPARGSCGKCVRGILCSNCNQGLGSFRDNSKYLKAAAKYIDGFVNE